MDSVISKIEMWAAECSADHDVCHSGQKPSQLPQRLLYLSPEGQDSDRAQLQFSEGQSYNYCALSYCWGDRTQNYGMTLTENIASRMNGFSIAELPHTIRDSITLCKRLGIFYIWIDSICIIQDDIHEWKAESSIMDQIYCGSLFTLIATSSGHANEGLFTPRVDANRKSWMPSRPPGRAYNLLAGVEPSWAAIDPDLGAALDTKIATRAWTLQEDFMSTRKIYWTQHGVVWSCPTHVQTEWARLERHSEASGPDSVEQQRQILAPYLRNRLAAFVQRNATIQIARTAWNDALTEYLPRQISYKEDRLAAIGGLVKVLQSQVQDEYIAGLWVQRLPEDLLWGVRKSSEDVLRREPTWTWASLPAKCTARAWLGYSLSSHIRYSCTILDVLTDPLDASIFGPIRSGRIQLQAKITSFPPRNCRRYEPAMPPGPAYHCRNHYVAVNFDLTSFSNEQYHLDHVECLKLVEMLGREYCLLIQPIDRSLPIPVYRRVGRAEIISENAPTSMPLFNSPGLLGMDTPPDSELGQFSVDTFFANCSDRTIELA